MSNKLHYILLPQHKGFFQSSVTVAVGNGSRTNQKLSYDVDGFKEPIESARILIDLLCIQLRFRCVAAFFINPFIRQRTPSSSEFEESLTWFIYVNRFTMREIVHLQAGQCGNQIGAKVSYK